MKVFIFFAFMLLGLSNCLRFPKQTQSSLAEILVKNIGNTFVSRLIKEERNVKTSQNKATLLPPFNETIIINPFLLPLDVQGEDISIVGEFELTSEGQIVGLGDISDDFNLIFTPPSVSWDLKIPNLSLKGEYRMEIDLNLGSDLQKVLGVGEMLASVKDSFFYMHATLKAVGYLEITKLEIDFGFENLKLEGGNASVNGEEIDWDQMSIDIQNLFDSIWKNNPEVKKMITEASRCFVSSIIDGCTLLELIGNTDCLGEGDLACLEIVLPTPDPTSETTVSSSNDPETTKTSIGSLNAISNIILITLFASSVL